MHKVTFIGSHPLARNPDGTLISRIATAFPRRGVIVTWPEIHALQRIAFVDELNRQREREGHPPLSPDEQLAEWMQAVDLIVADDAILIRPEPDNMDLAYEGDEMLQELPVDPAAACADKQDQPYDPAYLGPQLRLSKRKIRFLHVLDTKVRNAIQRRGEAWRIHPLPQSTEQMRKMVVDSRLAIGCRPIYYYNATTGTRWLTCHEFSALGRLDDEDLRRHLVEIAHYSPLHNALYRREVDFFGATDGFGVADLKQFDFAALPAPQLRAAWEGLCRKFESAVPPALLVDNVDETGWRNQMYRALIDRRDDVVSEEALLGLGSEYFMQVQWLPGARLEEGELIFDPVFEERSPGCDEHGVDPWESTARGLICNLMQEYGNMEYLNIGRVAGTLGRQNQKAFQGRRDVFIVQVKQRDAARELLQIIRMQKWDVRERLQEGRDLLQAMIDSEEYTEYILDRRLACRQIGMSLSPWVSTRKLAERYRGWQKQYEGRIIRSTYFQRDYIHGIASDKVNPAKLCNEEYATRLARLLGRAAAPNLIVGRSDTDGRLIFDDGDEVVIEDTTKMPTDIFVADHTGTFGNYLGTLADLAPNYANAVNRRTPHLANPGRFVQIYLDAFIERFEQIQAEYCRHQRAFNTLFKHRRRDPGTLAFRWECVLKRMAPANPRELAAFIRRGITQK